MNLKFSKKETTFILNLFLTTIVVGLIGVLNYFFNIVVARNTSSDIFGIYSAVLGIIYLIQIPVISIQSALTKTVAQNKETDLNHFKWKSLLIFFCLGLICAVAFFFFGPSISNIASIPQDTIIFLSIAFLFAFVSPISKGLLLGKEKVVFVNILLSIETVLKFVLGILAIKMGGSIWLLILANCVPAVLTTVVVLPFVKLNGKKVVKTVKIDYKELLLISVSFLLLATPYTLDLILVNSDVRASYSAVSLLGKLVYFAAITISAVTFARLANQDKSKNEKRTLLISLFLTTAIGLGVTLLLVLFKDAFVSLSVGDSYSNIAIYLGVFGLCMTGYAIVYMITNYFITEGDYGYIWTLLIVTILQIFLFTVRNDTLQNAIDNQIIVYAILTGATILHLYLYLKEKSEYEKRDIKKNTEVK